MPTPQEALELTKGSLIGAMATDPSQAPVDAAPIDDSQAELAGYRQGPSLTDSHQAYRQTASRQAGGYQRGASSATPMAQHLGQEKQIHAAAQQAMMQRGNDSLRQYPPDPKYGYQQPQVSAPNVYGPPQPQDWQKTGDDSRNIQVIRGGQESYYNTKTGTETAAPVGPHTQQRQPEPGAQGPTLREDQKNALQMMQRANVPVQHILDTYSHMMQDNVNTAAKPGGKPPSWATQHQADRAQLSEVDRQIKDLQGQSSHLLTADPGIAGKLAALQQQREGITSGMFEEKGDDTALAGAAPAPAAKPQQEATAGFHADEHGVPHPKAPGVKIDKDSALQFLNLANGDRSKAEQLAKQAGWGL